MKIQWLLIAALSVLLVFPTVAQDSWTTKAIASVPFKFVVNGTMLPAGHYRIMMYLGNSLLIQNIDNPDHEMIVQNRNVLLNPDKAMLTETKLIFVLNNGQQVLHRIGIVGDNHIHDIIHSTDVVELVATR